MGGELPKINKLSWLLHCHLLGPGFAFFCGRKDFREVAGRAGLTHRVFVELYCQKNKRKTRMNRTQEGTETGQDGVQGARGHQRPSASCLPLPALRRWCFNACSLQRPTTLWEVTELCSERSLAQCQPTNARVRVRP